MRNKYLVFIITIVVTVIVSQIIIQYDISRQYQDATIINIAGRQRMLSQRITNIAYSIHFDQQRGIEITQSKLDSLQLNCDRLSKVHSSLLVKEGINETLLEINTIRIKKINKACYQIITNPSPEQVARSLEIIKDNEEAFLFTMDTTVNEYNQLAQKKLDSLKLIELGLALTAIAILVIEFILFFRPALQKLQQKTIKLIEQTNSLIAINEDFSERQEDNLVNIEYITALQQHLTIREKQFRELVEYASDMIYELDEKGRFSYTNPVTENITEYSSEELKKLYYYDVVHPAFLQSTVEFYKQQRNNKQEISYLELQIVSKSGNLYWVGQNVRMIFEDKLVTKVSVVSRNITDLVNAREALLESEGRLRSLAEHAPVGIFQMNEKGNATFLNKRWCEIAGMGESEALGNGWIANIHHQDKNKVLHDWLQAVEEEKEFFLEFRFINPRLGIRWVIGQASQVLSHNGNLVGFIGTIHDVTELKEAQIKLEINEKLYRDLSENSQDLTLLSTAEGKLSYISNSSEKFLGLNPKELVNKSFFSLIHPEDLELAKIHWINVIRQETVKSIEFRITKKDGTFIWADSLMQVVHENKSGTDSIQINSRDITMRKKFEVEIHEAKVKAEEATKAKSNFLSMMSHEIRTPMNAIIGLTNILTDDDPRKDQLESLKLLKFSGENLMTIINDILDFSKIEAGKIELEKISFNLKDTLLNIVSMLRQRTAEKGVYLNLIYNEDVPEIIIGDSVRLTQIISNLVSNAIKFTEKGKVEVEVSLDSKVGDHYRINFAVKDTGIGIEAEKLEEIFERFIQARSDTTRKFGGTGLGLSITKHLLNLMDSTIQVESNFGKGSKFSFLLTVAKGNVNERKLELQQQPISYRTTGPIVILLVEDNTVNQVVACNFFKKWGMIAEVAVNGLEATEMIVSKKYDIVLMDLQMPEMDGYEATRVIRAMEDVYFKDIPILALTASAMMDIKVKVVETGMNDFITKPFQPDELRQKIISLVAANENSYSGVK